MIAANGTWSESSEVGSSPKPLFANHSFFLSHFAALFEPIKQTVERPGIESFISHAVEVVIRPIARTKDSTKTRVLISK
jgi:hypothetical protein